MPLDPTTTDAAPDWYTATPAQPSDAGATSPASQDQTPDWYKAAPQGADNQTPDWYTTGAEDKPAPTSSAGGAFARSAGEAAIPTAASIEGAIPAAEAGAAIGTAAAPFLGPAAPAGPVVGGILGGVAGAMGAGYLVSKGQDWVLDKLGLRDHLGLDEDQRQADTEEHPIASAAGSFLPALITMRPDATAGVGARLLSGGVLGGTTAVQEEAQNGEVSPGEVAMSALAGAALPGMRKPSTMIADALLKRTAGKAPIPEPAPRTAADPVKDNVGGATPTPQADSEDIDIAQDATMTAPGVAADNTPAPEVSGAGNPVGAPMSAREGADPSDPTRDYRKTGQGATSADKIETVASTNGVTLSDNPIKDDVAAALAPDKGSQEQVTPDKQPSSAPAENKNDPSTWRPLTDNNEQAPIETGLAAGRGQPPAPQDNTLTQEQQPVPAPAEPGSTASPGGEPVEPPVTAAVKPEDQMNINAVRARLMQPDMPKYALKKFDALSPEEQAAAANRGLAAHTAEQTAAKDAGYRDKLESGVQTGGGARAQRKTGALAAIKEAVTKFAPDKESIIPTSKEDKAALIDRLTKMVNHAETVNGGDPLRGPKGYKPREKPPEWQMLNSAKKVIAKPTPANIKAYITAEKLLSTGDAAAAKDLQDTDRIDADKNLRQLPANTSSQEAMIAKAEEGKQAARIDFPKFDNTSGDESRVFEGQQNDLRDWLNGLDDVDYRLLANRHPDLARNLDTTQDPKKLHTILDGDLEGLQKHSPGNLTPVDPDTVSGKQTPIITAADLKRLAPTEPGTAASEGKVLDKNSPAFKEAAARALAAQPTARAPDRIATEEAAAKANPQNTRPPEAAIDGTRTGLMSKLKEFGANEVGGGGGPSMSWLTGKDRSYWDASATPPEHEYGELLDHSLHVMGQKRIRDNVALQINALKTDTRTAREWQDAFRAIEKGDRSTLPQDTQDDLKEHFDPLMAKLQDVYEDYKAKRPDLNLPDWTDNYVPRMRKGSEIDPTEDQTDVLMNVRRGLSSDASNLKDREFFEAVTPGGLRTVFQPEPNGIRIYVNGKSKHYDVDNLGTETADPNYVGKQFTLGTQKYSVDHAWANNINTNVRDAAGKPLEYIESPILTASNAYSAIKTARDNWDMLQSILSSDKFAAFSERDSKVAREKGYEEITLPDSNFRGLWAAKPVARVLNDYSKPGFTFDSNDTIRRVNAALTKMIFTTPFPHALNETQLWATQRGFNWLPGNGNYGRLMRTGFRAMQSVNEQDHIQDTLAASGASPMLGGVLTRGNMALIAKHMGLEVQRDAPRFDPLFKTMGVRSSDLVDYWYKNVAQKPMWWWSDFLLTQQFLEHQEAQGARFGGLFPAQGGLSMQAAAQQSHKFISDYRVPTVALPGVLPDSIGRLISQAMTDNSVTMFGRYRYGIYKSMSNMAKGLVGPNATRAERVQAVGNLLAMAALGAGVWPLINKGIRTVTGNPGAELNSAGLLRELDTIQGNYGDDAEKDLGSIIKGVIQPAPLLTAVTDAADNKDWKGNPIVVRGQTFTPTGAGQAAEFAAGQIAPYKTIAQAHETATHEGGGVASALGRVVATQLGVKLSSAKQQAYELKLKGENAKLEKQRLKKPAGPIERGMNYLTH